MKKRYYLAVIVALLLLFAVPGNPSVCAAVDATHPGFRVEGRFLYDNQGEKVTLYGLNKMCTWTDKDGDPAFKEIAKTGANCVRITWDITDTAADLDVVLTNCRKEHMIPVIEVHNGTGKWQELTKLVDYWTKDDIAAVIISHQDYVILNIGNEVGDSTVTNEMFKKGYEEAITRIREAGIHVPLMIDGSNWGQDINILQACGPDLIEFDPDHNVLLSVHMWWPYMYGHTAQEVVDELNECVDMDLPIVVGEFGHEWEQTPTGQIPYKTIMEQCGTLDIGYIAWSWGPGNNPQEWLDMTSDGTFDTLNDYGTEICLTSEYSVKNLAKRPASMLCNLPPKAPAKGLPAGNLALGKKVKESTIEGVGYEGNNITDGSLTTRWASINENPAWVSIDLESSKQIDQVVIAWEAAHASQYKIQVSDDETNWTDAYTTYGCKGGTETIDIDAAGRYVRIYCMARANWDWGNSIWEVGIYGPESALSADINPTVATFDKNPTVAADLAITTDPKTNTLVAIKNGKETLVKGVDYTVAGDIVTISKNYLTTLTTGENVYLTFDYDENVDPVLAIAIGDTTPVDGSGPVVNVFPVSTTFNKYTAAQEDISFTINAKDSILERIYCGTIGMEEGTDYTVDGNIVTISKEFLANLPLGTNVITFSFANGAQTTAVVKVVFAAPNSTLDITEAKFEKKEQSDIVVTMNLYGNTLVSIKNGTYTLEEGIDYTIEENVVTIKKAYLASLPVGNASLVFSFNQGNDATMKVKVTNTIYNSSLQETLIEYNQPDQSEVSVAITFNHNTLVAIKNGSYTLVEGTDYTIDGNVVTFSNSYLASLNSAKTTLTFVFSDGADQKLVVNDATAAVSDLSVKADVNSWGVGYTVTFTVANTSNEAVDSWTIRIKKSDINITNIWCAEVAETDDYYIITPMSWNANLASGGSTQFGLQGAGAIDADLDFEIM